MSSEGRPAHGDSRNSRGRACPAQTMRRGRQAGGIVPGVPVRGAGRPPTGRREVVATTVAGYLGECGGAGTAGGARFMRRPMPAPPNKRKRRRGSVRPRRNGLCTLGLVGYGLWWRQARRARAADEALRQADRNRRLLYSGGRPLGVSRGKKKREPQCSELLLGHVPGPGQPDPAASSLALHVATVAPKLGQHAGRPRAAGRLAAGNRVVTLDETGKVTAWQIGDPSKREELNLPGMVSWA